MPGRTRASSSGISGSVRGVNAGGAGLEEVSDMEVPRRCGWVEGAKNLLLKDSTFLSLLPFPGFDP
jgi:hypothetical protein